ncbi:putative selenate ABC transporter substrate-binding protein [Prochlorococcus marinus]|uniref:putative selenate ABC transporter substrate-binding protein n=1 Tax=Prochlorococcus marinus TaxID=1219 RepID=UPI003B28D1E2
MSNIKIAYRFLYIKLSLSILLLGNILITNITYAEEKLIISAIPDQYPEKLNRLYKTLSNELSRILKVQIEYKPVINYQAAVTSFRTGDLDLVWFGGLTGVQARLQRPGAIVMAQRDIDKNFHSVIIVNTKSNIESIKKIDDLQKLKGRRFTFGSESSTSGRLMPEYYLNKANVRVEEFKGGRPGFSGSHDATIAMVQSNSYEAGVLNEAVWKSSLNNGKADNKKVKQIWRTPPYPDYHWLAQPNLDKRFGKGFTKKLQSSILSLNSSNKQQSIILEMFGAKRFIKAKESQYKMIEEIGRKIGKIR